MHVCMCLSVVYVCVCLSNSSLYTSSYWACGSTKVLRSFSHKLLIAHLSFILSLCNWFLWNKTQSILHLHFYNTIQPFLNDFICLVLQCHLVCFDLLIPPFELITLPFSSQLQPRQPSCTPSSFPCRTFTLAVPLPGTLFPQNFSLCYYSLSPFTLYLFPSIHLSVHDIIYLFVYHQSSSLEYKIHEVKDFHLFTDGSLPHLENFLKHNRCSINIFWIHELASL